ncbi:hypothetical protein FO510_05540 [Bacillus pumilus]|uniref:hypothetical protein n=1 Tax=Bacillus pumilus TaxID=1408 RepID=UPI00017A5F4E|nr:hypothetical protein [Bacillus pumilus]EDW22328.1 conserved hypothetical protein [Bacillus pumilus ATCC 7061]MCR4352169.1 hypothetical protein [Bacillus pumilus]MCY7503980.1 hypothetical protein [Bacillus pumilus]MDR4269027.1 hypothetical protein [Bacillus pumilus]MDR4269114.1 hypothetical protein [Bacillus pumilus]
MKKTKWMTAILGISIAGNAALGIYAVKLNDDVDVAYRVADDMALEAETAQETVQREYIVEGADYAVSADDGGFAFNPDKVNANPGDRISVEYTKKQYEDGSGYKKVEVIDD